ncbi:hypothetical protein BGZ61DRAFT_223455 [Ilyonectria robusta]|uniref:uncharacterized protein n=1 Tax=Ilyonectria robusta TaxID=1079257 RepID=UPI001E8E5CF6|nr:uncharacterized protein BGZ61DRAFT_223455 [Ilyonectria robusta]KAH8706558.1 hypothetical protein BGZ61DRAFT_223455 [Ilyonectria robusta]
MEYTPTSQAPSRPICPDIRGEASIYSHAGFMHTVGPVSKYQYFRGGRPFLHLAHSGRDLPEPRWRSLRQNVHTWSMRHRETRLCSLEVNVEFLLRLDHPLAPHAQSGIVSSWPRAPSPNPMRPTKPCHAGTPYHMLSMLMLARPRKDDL